MFVVAPDSASDLASAALGENLVSLRRIIDQLEGEFARLLDGFDRSQGFAADGHLSTASWLRDQCRLPRSVASEKLSVARRLGDLPQTAAALADGEIGYEHVRVLARTAEQVGPEIAQNAEPILLDAARKLDPWRLRVACLQLRHCVDPDGTLADANRAHEHRWLALSQTFGGVFAIDGVLDAEGGACLAVALNALTRPSSGDSVLSAGRRRADALVELARQALDGGRLPQVAGQRPHLSAVVPIETLRGEPGAPGAELEWGGFVPAETVRRLACDCALAPIIVDGQGRVLDVGRSMRTNPASLRRGLVARDGGCRFPGCDRPPDWTDGHHLKHWADGGETNLENLVLLCRRHHRLVHEEGWQLAWTAERELLALPP